jgi:DMSO/TMAO reductase YedYZ molybdopterin-dependent catalytic subunit
MVNRLVNTVLLVLMGALLVSGVVMLYTTWLPWVFDVHRIMGFAVIALLPWKVWIVYRSLRRRIRDHGPWLSTLASLPLAVLLLLVIGLALMWMWRVGPYQTVLAQTVIAWHWMLGLGMTPFFIAHVWLRWPRPRVADFASRRGTLRLLGLGAAGVVGWLLSVAIARIPATEERPRRPVTGSRGFGRFTANIFPVTGEGTVEIDVAVWRLSVEGAVDEALSLTYDEIHSMAEETRIETLDCTSGWYTVQQWTGIPLVRILEEAGAVGAAGVRLVSATGYNHTYSMAEARAILLATHVGEEVLAPRHGYPLRAIVPDRRGWFWVKWLVRVEVLESRAEVLAGIAAAARQILRQL